MKKYRFRGVHPHDAFYGKPRCPVVGTLLFGHGDEHVSYMSPACLAGGFCLVDNPEETFYFAGALLEEVADADAGTDGVSSDG